MAKNSEESSVLKRLKKKGGDAAVRTTRTKTNPYKDLNIDVGSYYAKHLDYKIKTSSKQVPAIFHRLVVLCDKEGGEEFRGQLPMIYLALEHEDKSLEELMEKVMFHIQALGYQTSDFELDDIVRVGKELNKDKPLFELRVTEGRNGGKFCNIVGPVDKAVLKELKVKTDVEIEDEDDDDDEGVNDDDDDDDDEDEDDKKSEKKSKSKEKDKKKPSKKSKSKDDDEDEEDDEDEDEDEDEDDEDDKKSSKSSKSKSKKSKDEDDEDEDEDEDDEDDDEDEDEDDKKKSKPKKASKKKVEEDDDDDDDEDEDEDEDDEDDKKPKSSKPKVKAGEKPAKGTDGKKKGGPPPAPGKKK